MPLMLDIHHKNDSNGSVCGVYLLLLVVSQTKTCVHMRCDNWSRENRRKQNNKYENFSPEYVYCRLIQFSVVIFSCCRFFDVCSTINFNGLRNLVRDSHQTHWHTMFSQIVITIPPMFLLPSWSFAVGCHEPPLTHSIFRHKLPNILVDKYFHLC